MLNTIHLNFEEKKSLIFIDNTNFLIANLENPFKFMNFMIQAHKNPSRYHGVLQMRLVWHFVFLIFQKTWAA